MPAIGEELSYETTTDRWTCLPGSRSFFHDHRKGVTDGPYPRELPGSPKSFDRADGTVN
jgi:hypothetical protein